MTIETVTQPQITNKHDGNWVRRARSLEGGLQITRGARFVGSVWVVSQFPVVHLFTGILLSFLFVSSCVIFQKGLNKDLQQEKETLTKGTISKTQTYCGFRALASMLTPLNPLVHVTFTSN